MKLFGIGHSTHALEAFVRLLVAQSALGGWRRPLQDSPNGAWPSNSFSSSSCQAA